MDRTSIERVIERNPATKSYLALLGDKQIQFNEAGTAFVMYGMSGRSWIALGDPIGPSEMAADLIHRFVQASKMQAARPVFHEVGPDHLASYSEVGLASFHIADEARVRLANFSLEGSRMRPLRNHIRGAARRGCCFELLSCPVRDSMLADLRSVSNEWLDTLGTREKRFSMGCFETQYLRHFHIGVVRQSNAVVGFVTIWTGMDELFIDLMRHCRTAPPGSMDFLIVSVIDWAQSAGYRWLNLGMAPLPEQDVPLSLQPPSGWMVKLARHLGERFYHFSGLRRFKSKFTPEWRRRYFVSPAGYSMVRALADLAVLTSGGWRGVLSR